MRLSIGLVPRLEKSKERLLRSGAHVSKVTGGLANSGWDIWRGRMKTVHPETEEMETAMTAKKRESEGGNDSDG